VSEPVPEAAIEVAVTEYGRAASERLHKTIAHHQQGNALAPVTVVVPSNFAGLVARRLLGGAELGGNGLANVSFVTAFRLAEMLAAGELSGKLPLTNPVLGAAVRQALAEDPRHFARVRNHQATERAVAAAFAELSNVRAAGLEAIVAAGGFPKDVVELYRSIRAKLAGFHDEAVVARAARNRPDLAHVVATHGAIVWFLPDALNAPLAHMIGAVLRAATEATIIVGASGVTAADREVRATLARAGVDPATVWPEGEVAETLAGHVVSVSDADEEVRQVVRQVVALVDAGVRLDRIGVFHPVPDPYVRLLEQHFAAAEIPANGPSRRRTSDAIAGRVLLGALALPDERWRRDRVMAMLAAGPIRYGDGFAYSVGWDAISRTAGVVGGRADWTRKLAARTRRLDQWIDEAATAGQTHPPDPRAGRHRQAR